VNGTATVTSPDEPARAARGCLGAQNVTVTATIEAAYRLANPVIQTP
jgi:hypothetical protein